jgi:hypothetical protein
MRLDKRLLIALGAALTMTACATSAPRESVLPKPLPAASLQLCPEPGPAPGNEVDDVAAALMDLYGLYGRCAGMHAELVRALEGKK